MKCRLLTVLMTVSLSMAMGQNRSIIVLGNGNTGKGDSRTYKRSHEVNTAVSIGALNFVAGNLPLCFEKEYKNFGLLVGAGPTFRRFYDNTALASVFDEDDVKYSWDNTDWYTTYNPFGSESRPKFKYKTGYYFVASPRYYYNEEGIEGPYVGIQFTMSRYNYSNPRYEQTSYTAEGRDKYTDLSLVWGSRFGGEKIIFDFYSGLGVRFKDEQRYAYAIDDVGMLHEGTASVKKSGLRLELGLRMGFKF